MRKRLSGIAGLASGFAIALGAFAAGLAPPPPMDVAAWAAEERVVSAESGSPYPGKWDPARVPHLQEIMDCLSLSHPSTRVAFKKSAQVAGTEAGINLFGAIVCRQPVPVLIVLPTLDEAAKYNRIKLQPAIDATPALAARVREAKSRDAEGSTAAFKRFPGGYAVITGANSSAGLQMISARVLVFEEISEYPHQVGDRGEPVALARKRALAYTDIGIKEFHNSTPGLKVEGENACRVTKEYERSDRRRRYVPCPQCGAYQVLLPDSFKWRADAMPTGAYFVCMSGNGCVIEARFKAQILARGVWLKTYEDEDPANPAPPPVIEAAALPRWVAARGHASDSRGREPGFAIWQAYSPFVNWDATAFAWIEAKAPGGDMKTFTQQVLGEPYEIKGEAPAHELLFERREHYPPARIPPGATFTTLTVDVQGNRLEWAVYAWANLTLKVPAVLSAWLVDKGIIEGDPNQNQVWLQLDRLVQRRYADAWGHEWPFDAVGIDTGYLKNRVGLWARKYADTPYAPDRKVFPLDGRPGWNLPPLGTASKQSIDWAGKKYGAFEVWPVGGYDLKRELYTALRYWLEGPDLATGTWIDGAAHYNQTCDRAFFRQLTAESVQKVEKRGVDVLEWVRDRSTPNEQHDLAVYARALAHHLCDSLTPSQWAALHAARAGRPEDAQGDLAALWTTTAAAPPAEEMPEEAAPQPSLAAAAAPAAWIDRQRASAWLKR